MGTRDDVLARLDADDPNGAARVAREILAVDPQDADVLGLLGLALEARGDTQAGADALRRAVALRAGPSITLRNTTNLAAMLIAANLSSEANALLRTGWQWPVDTMIGDNERQCLALLADIMLSLGLNQELAEFLQPILKRLATDWDLLRRLVHAFDALGECDKALEIVEALPALPSKASERDALLAHLYARTGDLEKAEKAHAAYSCNAPPYVAPPMAQQWFTIGVLNPAPSNAFLLAPQHERHFNSNFPAQLAHKLAARYRFASILLGAGSASAAAFTELNPRVLINNVVNAEVLLDGWTLAAVEQLAKSTDVPTINPPERAALCTRQMNAERFAHLPHAIVPRLKRILLKKDHIDEIIKSTEQSFRYPMIVRTVRDHEASNICLAGDRETLREALVRSTQPQIYIVEYVGAPRRKGCYRRIRAGFVDGVPTVVRVDYDEDWIVQGRKRKPRQEFYRRHPDLLADADDIASRPVARLGPSAMATLETIGRSLPLDIFGLDFDVDESGNVVFFEANASMNILSTAPAGFDYPPACDTMLLERIEHLMHARATHCDDAPADGKSVVGCDQGGVHS